jgi:phosphoglycerol transferase MdoB-like AlkP superfamily enzyme
LFYAVLVNVPVWAASYFFAIDLKGWFGLEYLLAGLLAVILPRGVSAALLLALIAADLVGSVGSSYLLTPWDCLTSLGSLAELPPRRLLLVGLSVLLALAATTFAALVSSEDLKRNYPVPIVSCLVLIFFLYVAADYFSMFEKTGRVINFMRVDPQVDGLNAAFLERRMLARYPLIRLVRDGIVHRSEAASGRATDTSALPSAASLAELLIRGGEPGTSRELPNLVLILVESWGRANNPSLGSALVGPYEQPELEARYRMLEGTVPFYGGTVAAEARELCGNRMGLHLVDASERTLENCLPNRLRNLGYRTVALHGMSSRMFDRRTWYGTIGFDETWFRDRLTGEGLPDCFGAFAGTCDASIAGWIGKRLSVPAPDPQFVYWVTLNSHLPVPIPTQVDRPAPCAPGSILGENPPLCSWYQLIVNVHRAVDELAMSALARPTVFVVVGDHAPPFAAPDLKAQFAASVVPYVILIPRALDRPELRPNDVATMVRRKLPAKAQETRAQAGR